MVYVPKIHDDKNTDIFFIVGIDFFGNFFPICLENETIVNRVINPNPLLWPQS